MLLSCSFTIVIVSVKYYCHENWQGDYDYFSERIVFLYINHIDEFSERNPFDVLKLRLQLINILNCFIKVSQ